MQAKVDYTTITELPGDRASQEQLGRLYSRYAFASEYCRDKTVLELACGAGIGLGYLARFARKVIGGDIDENNLRIAIKNYRRRKDISILPLDATCLPFQDKSLDVVILYEAIYYIEHPERFVREARRVLREDGVLLISTVNKAWADFNPSPYSRKYFSAPELSGLLRGNGFAEASFYGDCPIRTDTMLDMVLSVLKRTAVALHIMPSAKEGKEFLKRIFFGKLLPIPAEIEADMNKYSPPVPVASDSPHYTFKILFAVARQSPIADQDETP